MLTNPAQNFRLHSRYINVPATWKDGMLHYDPRQAMQRSLILRPAFHHVQGPPEHVMIPDRPEETLQESVDDSLRSLVQAADTLIQMCIMRSRENLNLHTQLITVWGPNPDI